MYCKKIFLAAAIAAAVFCSGADLITKSVSGKKADWKPFKVCVLDFTTLDIAGQKRFLDGKNLSVILPPQESLNEADRKSMNGVMQGFVRMIDAWDHSKSQDINRSVQVSDNNFNRLKALDLYRTTVQGEARPVVIGAQYLSAYLGRYNDVFACVPAELVSAAMKKLQESPDFPRDFMLQTAKTTGATHVIYGTVSDIRKESKSFKGYGIETKTTTYQLDVIIKLVDLVAQHTVYSNVYTGKYREQRLPAGNQIDHNIFHNLMKAALEQAAEDLYDHCRPGRKNKITVTPFPFKLTVTPVSGMLSRTVRAEIFVNGARIAQSGEAFLLPAGMNTVEIRAAGYRNKKIELNVKADQNIKITLEK